MVNNRKVYYLRVFYCLAVIMIHVFVTARTDFPNHTNFEEILCKIIPNILHFAVPIFFMITGYLFLIKKTDIKLSEYVKKYVLKYIYAIFTFGFGYAILEEIFNKNYSIEMPLTALINTIQGKTWAHMWYLYSLVGVMLFIPILKTILEKDKKVLNYLSLILLTSSIIIPTINSIFNIKIGFDLLIIAPYLLYAIIGYYLGISEKKIDKRKCILGIILCSIIIIITEILGVTSENNIIKRLAIFGRYNSIVILIMSMFFFLLFKTIKKVNKYILEISKQSYGIYILHMFWINLIYKFMKFNIFNQYIFFKVVIVFIITFILSYASTKILKCIPVIKNII